MPQFKSGITGRFLRKANAMRWPGRSYELGRKDLIGPGQKRDLQRALLEYNEYLDARGALTADADGLIVPAVSFADEWVQSDR